MQKEDINKLIDGILNGNISKNDAVETISNIAYKDMDFAKIDTHRKARTGNAEVVFCQGKTDEQIIAIMNNLRKHSDCIMGTRLTKEAYLRIKDHVKDASYNEMARIILSGKPPKIHDLLKDKYVSILSAGTADMSVAEEAAVVCETLGSPVNRIYDVGVAGIHRLLDKREIIQKSNVIIVCAGMEGALPSVVGGLVSCPVIAVPTSIGYGASFNGLAALLAMLNTCASGISVVNIDNGFGAGYLAHSINKTNLDIK